ncbi:hypothetical protein CKO15_13065 [Halorhodospira abdelmalekii]|uniref:hypothetical protein n=1 Tax=Halorhodospira abdelmalekii TaxID=421629 RepID=UPI0019037A2D|nr:hypothetical protein [Halorhodospira abdelmalekii]MBK1736182.1 hypothetical protein [Halorhodospira abdelmalekii]
MALAEGDHEQINAYIEAYLKRWLEEQRLVLQPPGYDRELHERITRVEEALKHQGELMQQGFAQIDKRLEQVDKRFEAMQQQMDKRFEAMQQQMDKRFEAMQQQMDKRFEAMQQQMDKHFEQVDKRFEQIDKRLEQVDKRFDQVESRFEQVDKRFEEMIRRQDKQHHLVLGFIVGSLGLMITVMLTAMRFMG